MRFASETALYHRVSYFFSLSTIILSFLLYKYYVSYY